jgi:hypothetical protein
MDCSSKSHSSSRELGGRRPPPPPPPSSSPRAMSIRRRSSMIAVATWTIDSIGRSISYLIDSIDRHATSDRDPGGARIP